MVDIDKRTKAYKDAVAFLKTLEKPSDKALLGARKRLEAAAKPKKEPKPKAPRVKKIVPPDEQMVTIQLKVGHWVGGLSYGPGTVKVPQAVARGLLEDERRIAYNNARFDGSQAAFIGPKNRVMHVPTAVFDSPMLNVLEAFVLQ